MSDQNPQHTPREHVYRPIEESAYRVIHLLPGTFTDDIRCVLETRPEVVMTSYEAISYQWGDESITRPISVAPMRSRIATTWPLLESANMALEKFLRAIHFHLTLLIPLCILVWCMGIGFIRHLSSPLPKEPRPWDCPTFMPQDIFSAAISAFVGLLISYILGILISRAIEVTETKPLFFLLDLIFGPISLKHPMEFTTLRVTTNLESALRQLRKEKQMRTLWIDALCIDQKNDDEKRAQVQRMDRIYANATSTTIWLGGYHGLEEPKRCGGEHPKCEHSLQIEAAFNYVLFLSGWRTFFRLNSVTDEQRLFLASRQGFIELAKRGWWERLWVIQEVSLSTGRVYIRCGRNTCRFEDFQSAWDSLYCKHSELRHDFMPSIHLMTTIKDFRYSSDQDQLSPSWEDRYNAFRTFPPTQSFHGLRFPERLQRILLQTSGRFKCRDDRDRLYAVLGIAAGITVGPRRTIAFFMRRPIEDPPTMIINCLSHALRITSDNGVFLAIKPVHIGRFVEWIWFRYYDLIIRYWTICRPEYVTTGHIRDLDDLKGRGTDRTGFFTALAGYLAQETGNLSFLDAVSCAEDEEDTVPSWVPDWSKEVSLSAYTFAECRDWTKFRIIDAGKTLQVEGRCRTIFEVIHAADLQEFQSLPGWQGGFEKSAALPSKERLVLLRLLSELGRLTSPDHSNELGRSEKWRALLLFFHASNCLKAGLVRMKSQNTTVVYTDNAIAEGIGYLRTGKVNQGDILLSVPGTFHHMVLRQGKMADRWRIVGLVDMEHTEDWAKLRKDDRLWVVTIE